MTVLSALPSRLDTSHGLTEGKDFLPAFFASFSSFLALFLSKRSVAAPGAQVSDTGSRDVDTVPCPASSVESAWDVEGVLDCDSAD